MYEHEHTKRSLLHNPEETRMKKKETAKYVFLRAMCNIIILPFIHVITNDKKQQKKLRKIKSCMNGFILLKCARITHSIICMGLFLSFFKRIHVGITNAFKFVFGKRIFYMKYA